MKVTKDYAIVNPVDHMDYQPTRLCLVCERKECPNTPIVDTDKAWLCPKCKAALQFIVDETIEGGKEIGKH